MALEAAAADAHADALPWRVVRDEAGLWVYDPAPTLGALLADGGREVAKSAAGFHHTVAEVTVALVGHAARRSARSRYVCPAASGRTGGSPPKSSSSCDADGFDVFFNQRVPCNDGGICYGQAAIAAAGSRGGEAGVTGRLAGRFPRACSRTDDGRAASEDRSGGRGGTDGQQRAEHQGGSLARARGCVSGSRGWPPRPVRRADWPPARRAVSGWPVHACDGVGDDRARAERQAEQDESGVVGELAQVELRAEPHEEQRAEEALGHREQLACQSARLADRGDRQSEAETGQHDRDVGRGGQGRQTEQRDQADPELEGELAPFGQPVHAVPQAMALELPQQNVECGRRPRPPRVRRARRVRRGRGPRSGARRRCRPCRRGRPAAIARVRPGRRA